MAQVTEETGGRASPNQGQGEPSPSPQADAPHGEGPGEGAAERGTGLALQGRVLEGMMTWACLGAHTRDDALACQLSRGCSMFGQEATCWADAGAAPTASPVQLRCSA